MQRVTFEVTEEIIYRIRAEFPQCIECGDNHLSRNPTYFHRRDCKRGAGLSTDELTIRMNARAAELQRLDALRENVAAPRCEFCAMPATGTFWERYHHHTAVSETYMVCENHAGYKSDTGRECGYIPGMFIEPGRVNFVLCAA